jgi:nucleoid DNA-binding protein
MVELAIYIKNLLYNYDRVIIPGFGSLQTLYKAAQINTSNNSIAPPSKYLVFEQDSVISDELLIHFIASQRKISIKEGEDFFSSQLSRIHQKLDSGETILLEGIGYFSKENGVIRFDREEGVNFLTDSFGLSTIDYKPVEFDLTPIETPKISEIERNETAETTHIHKKKNYTITFIIIGFIIIAGAGAVAYVYNPSMIINLKKYLTKSSVSRPPATTDENKTDLSDTTIVKTDTKDTTHQSDLETFFDKSTDKKSALAITKDSVSSAPSDNVEYYIIAGSFKTYKRASVLAKELKKEHYKPEVIQFDQELYRVSLGEFKDKNEATKELEKLKLAKGGDAVWLLSKKL